MKVSKMVMLFIVIFVVLVLFAFLVEYSLEDCNLEKTTAYSIFWTKKQKKKREWKRNLKEHAYLADDYGNYAYHSIATFSEFPHVTFQEFLQYYILNPDAWYIDDNCEICVYRYNDKTKEPMFLLFYPFEEYYKFFKWREKLIKESEEKAQKQKECELEKNRRKEKIAILELIQKDIDALKAQSEKEITTAKEITEKIKENLNC